MSDAHPLPPPAGRPPAVTTRVPERDVEPAVLHDFFRRAARRWPDNVAIDAPAAGTRRTMTYADLDRRSDALARRLADFVSGECVVAILLPRNSEHIYLAQLGVLKAGAAYCCIDPAFPDAQVGTILGDARPVAVLTDAAGLTRGRRVRPDQKGGLDVVDWSARSCHSGPPLGRPHWLTPRTLAYVIYTSGTTGRPKGVMVEHGGIANLVRGDTAELPVTPNDRVGQNSSCAYDSSVEEIWMAFANGATLVVMDDDTTRLGPDLVPWLRAEGVTIFSPPPTLLRATGCAGPEKELPLLRRVHVGGEALPPDVVARWAPGRCLVNDYGPTECSVTALRTVVRPGEPIAIGRPVPGVRAWVLDDRLAEVGVGEAGELCLGGAGLARGYLGDAALTARKFPDHPRLGRIYRTGDLARRDASGRFFCLGRIDTQVKVRGYRIELEAIESGLAACPGVRAAGCRVQGEGPGQQIVAFVVPATPAAPPGPDDLKAALRVRFPEYMVPSHIGILPALPTTVSGKLDRRALPVWEAAAATASSTGPRGPVEEAVAAAARVVLGRRDPVPMDHDFFTDLGGDSLRAAMLISRLRDDPATAGLTVRDVYEARTLEGLARRATPVRPPSPVARPAGRSGRPVLATAAQTAWHLGGFVLAGPAAYLVAYRGVPELTRDLGLAPFALAAPLLFYAGLGVYALLAVAFAVGLKRVLIGRYRPAREPIWGSLYVRNWIVTRAVRLIPWRALSGTVFPGVILRLLGARVGKRVHIHRGVNLLQGGWDLLDLGDDVTLGRDALVRLVDFDAGHIVIGPVAIGPGCTLDVRAGVAGHTRLEPDAFLAAHAFLTPGSTVPSGERWANVPAAPAGRSPDRPEPPRSHREMSPLAFSAAILVGRAVLGIAAMFPVAALALGLSRLPGVDADHVADWVLHPALDPGDALLGTIALVLAVPAGLLGQCLSMRTLGRVREGVVGRWSWEYARVWLKAGILDGANEWLSGTLLWRAWLRGAGMAVGRDTELSTVLDTVPELVEIGAGSFLADGIYLGGPRVHRGTVTLARTALGDGVFLGNYAVVPAGTRVPDGVLLGVCTTADEAALRPGTAWFGQPSFELPRREVIAADPGRTYHPSWGQYARRVFWEILRFAIPVIPAALVLGWFALLGRAEPLVPPAALAFGVVPALDLGIVAALALAGLALKWALLGRVRPGTHELWSGWCSRWDFNYTAGLHYYQGVVGALDGTLWLNWYLRAMGVRVGRGVFIEDGFALTVDPDMIACADGATVSALFQAHTFEDRVLKLGRVRIGRRATVGGAAVLLYGAEIGEGARVVANSVVMKHERLPPGRTYAGCPTRPGP